MKGPIARTTSLRALRTVLLVAAAVCLAMAATTSWAARSQKTPTFLRFGADGKAFYSYDGHGPKNERDTTTKKADLDRDRRDWPITMIFHGSASKMKVRAGLNQEPTNPLENFSPDLEGRLEWEPFRKARNGRPNPPKRFNPDQGRKTRCNTNRRDTHIRLYGDGNGGSDSGTERFYDPGGYEYFVVASVHFDRAESTDPTKDQNGDGDDTDPGDVNPCYQGKKKKWNGKSEEATRFVERVVRRHPSFFGTVQEDEVDTKNFEGEDPENAEKCGEALAEPPYREDMGNEGHRWQNDGCATLVQVLP
jgi:hypothetical protein